MLKAANAGPWQLLFLRAAATVSTSSSADAACLLLRRPAGLLGPPASSTSPLLRSLDSSDTILAGQPAGGPDSATGPTPDERSGLLNLVCCQLQSSRDVGHYLGGHNSSAAGKTHAKTNTHEAFSGFELSGQHTLNCSNFEPAGTRDNHCTIS